jgi:hypothetical protein
MEEKELPEPPPKESISPTGFQVEGSSRRRWQSENFKQGILAADVANLDLTLTAGRNSALPSPQRKAINRQSVIATGDRADILARLMRNTIEDSPSSLYTEEVSFSLPESRADAKRQIISLSNKGLQPCLYQHGISQQFYLLMHPTITRGTLQHWVVSFLAKRLQISPGLW